MKRTINLDNLDGNKGLAAKYTNMLLEEAALRIVKELNKRAFEQHEILLSSLTGVDNLAPEYVAIRERLLEQYKDRHARLLEIVNALKFVTVSGQLSIDTKT